ncbi:MAG: DUF2182 domain-containing protein [Chloroflexota bacterium]|nr:DUF2182 domain-containing protein [Chloroflexota bacterium]
MEARYGRLALSSASGFILLALLGLAATAWTYLGAQPMAMMASSSGLDATDLVLFTATWTVMMAAMMFPSVAPVVLVYSNHARRQSTAWIVRTALFVGGYLVTWAGFGVVAFFLASVLSPVLGSLPWAMDHPELLVGPAILLAAIYQLTPLKDRCLSHCRSPIHWVLHGFRPGASGALAMGVTEGVFCVGCCVGLMVVLFAVGLASLAWMALVAAVIFVEKVLAPTRRVSRVVSAGLAVLGLFIAVTGSMP